MPRKKLSLFDEKVESVSLNIKIPKDLSMDIEVVRQAARKQGKTFKLNGFVVDYLEGLIADAREELGIKESIAEARARLEAEKKTTKKVEK